MSTMDSGSNFDSGTYDGSTPPVTTVSPPVTPPTKTVPISLAREQVQADITSFTDVISVLTAAKAKAEAWLTANPA